MSFSPRPTADGHVARSTHEAPFVGRDVQLGVLLGALDDSLVAGRPHHVLVEGAAGIGKSRLVREFLGAARDRASTVAVLQGRCLATSRGSSHWALGEVLRRACGIGLDDRADEAEARLREGVGRILAPLGLVPTERDDTLHALATSAGIVVPGNPFDRGEPQIVPAAITHAWVRFLRAHTRRGGAILVIEDLHWAGSALIATLSQIAARLDGPFVFVATARPAFLGREPGFLDGPRRTVVELPPLSPDEAAGLVDGVAPGAGLTDDIRASVVARAEGNPYFLEESVRHALERGAPGQAMPDSIQAVLVARIEGLPLAERRVLQEAAVVGRIFWEGPVRRALGTDDVGDLLRRLGERGLVFTRPTSSLSGEVELSFKHALLRDAAYGTMTAVHRARSHAAVGAWLEEISRGHEGEVDAMIGDHLRLAIEQDAGGAAWTDPTERESVRTRAIRYLLAAGTRAHQRFALDKAVELHEAALRLAATDVERARALAALGQDHESGLRGEAAIDAYRGAIEAAERGGLPAEEQARLHLAAARTMAIRWGSFATRPQLPEIDAFVDAGMALAEDPETRLWLMVMSGAAAVRAAPARLTGPAFREERSRAVTTALDGARQLGLTDLLVLAGRVEAQLQFAAGRYAEAATVYRELIPQLDNVDSMFQRALTAMYVVVGLTDIEGAYAEALPVARTVLELGRKLSPHEHAHGTSSVMWCLYHLGDWSETEELVEEHLEAIRGADVFNCPYMRNGPLIGALVAGHLGDFERSRELLAQFQHSADEPGIPEALHARVLVALGEADAGAAAAQKLIDSGRVPSLEENAHEVVALLEALVATGGWDRLEAFLPEARRRIPMLAMVEPVSDRAEGLVAAARNQTEDAVTLLGRALAGFERLGVPYEIARTNAFLARVLPDSDAALADALAAAESLFAGRTPGVAGGAAATAPPAEPPTIPDDALTDREREILDLIGEGIGNHAIAERLGLSPRTVERHVSNIYVKLGLEGRSARAAAASYAVRSSLRVGRHPPTD
jgi:DNA-binding CsgD family transcriptional regulator/tetratricopeptide (TPR) repeat protein